MTVSYDSVTVMAWFHILDICLCVPVEVKHLSSPLDTTETDSKSAAMTVKVRTQAQIKEDSFTQFWLLL